METYIVYHSPCLDGLGAAVAAYCFNPKFNFIPFANNKTSEQLIIKEAHNSVVLFFDCAPLSRETFEILRQQGNTVKVFDHHVGNKHVLENETDCYFDMNKSGCQLAWDYFFPREPIPQILHFIGERDLWRFTDPSTRYVGYALMDLKISTIQELLSLVQGGDVTTLVEHGKSILESIDKKCALLEPKEATWLGKRIMVAETDGYLYTSELAEYMYMKYTEVDFVVMYYKHDASYKLSLRTNKDNIDLSVIARTIGGNGHAKASGALVDILPWVVTQK